ncbi:sulfotransferase domain-containing protein [Formosa sp. A9]|uniref:sulfotransferase domain-containing protein n=1 Tax=Formosa sp. A9 TaxID=3442641 RepID=UPI003EBE216A
MQPQFIVAGAAKAGTTALCEYLGRDPKIFMTSPKELDFFLRPRTPEDVEEYSVFFKNAGQLLAGEGSVSYLSNAQQAAPQLKANFPNLKLVFMLRNPVDRYVSDFWFYVAKGTIVNKRNLFENILLGKESLYIHNGKVNFRDYLIERGQYAQHLKIFMQYFDASQIHIIFFEDFIKEQERTIKDLYKFLGVDYVRKEQVVKQSNKTVYPGRMMPLFVLWKNVKRFLPTKIVNNKAFKDKLLGVKSLFFNNKKPKLSQASKEKLNKIYKTSITDLEVLLNKDLSHWKL